MGIEAVEAISRAFDLPSRSSDPFRVFRRLRPEYASYLALAERVPEELLGAYVAYGCA